MKIKKWDIIIISLFVLISFIPAAVFALQERRETSGLYAEIKVQGEVFQTVKLTGHTGREEIRIETELGVNIVEVVDEKIGMYEADCPDQICYSPEFVSKPGETIVCLPHRVVVEVKGEAPEKDGTDIIAYGGEIHDHE